ncbi:malonyl-ACP O-methyltransferase BioC [Marinobacter similis]|uniref:Malonyl-[acyl-carrier protein] O-methyltransferase n=1 Tax=Marinobacter similis TaxID=1420916 RepID=W5YJ18_9GAMM|nr:malonyl-ACP O-methyltransferase BioC [Marinobacter similis]AHI29076.1 malonyl-CoA O-methyltransferase [Marinobacter similis]
MAAQVSGSEQKPGLVASSIADKSLIASQFGGASKTYDGASRLQRIMGEEMLDALKLSGDGLRPRRILDLGCGTGWFTRKIEQRWPCQVTGVDLSPGMIGQASEQSGPAIEWLVADAESLPFPSDSFDVVFSNLMVQWCDDPRTVFAECQRVLRPGGRLVLSTLLEGTLSEFKQAWAMADPGQQHINRFESEVALRQRVEALLPDARVDTRTIALPYASPMALAAELRLLGAGFKSEDRRKTLTAPSRVRTMCRNYPKQSDGTVVASYEAAWVYWRAS